MTRPNRTFSSQCATLALAIAFSAAAAAAKPTPMPTYSDVEITFGGQTFGFGGIEESFSQTAEGERVVLQLTDLSTPGYVPLPPVDVSTLSSHGNHWEIQTDHGKRSDVAVGTCASATVATVEFGVMVRHVYLNCSDLQT